MVKVWPSTRGPDWMLTSVSYMRPAAGETDHVAAQVRRVVDRISILHRLGAAPAGSGQPRARRHQQQNGDPNALGEPGFGRARELFRGVPRKPVYFRHLKPHLKNIANIETLNLGATVGAQSGAAPSDRGWTARRTSLPDESRIDVGPMNHGVAGDAGRTVRRSCVHPMDRAGGNRAVALVA